VVIGVLTAVCAVPIADVLAAGRATVRTFLIVGLMLTPLSLLILLLNSSLVALERWRSVVVMNMMPFIIPLTADVVLFAVGDLTVATAAAAPIVGSAMAVGPGIPLLLQARRPAFRFSLMRASIGFGLKSWLGGLAQTANARADQLLMITLVPARQLGLYAVATTISGAYGLITGGVAPPLMSRIGAGERMLVAQAVRMTLAMTIGLNLVIAPATPIILALLFGPQFRGAAPMAFILLGASVPLAGGSVLSGALQADGAPLIPTVAEAIALVITGVGLVLLLPPLQGVGAAIVSLAAYSTSFCYQLIRAARRLGLPVSDFLVPGHADVVWARRRFADVTLRLRAVTR
jgi:O-antigen/teichoic acid export membrane protein